MIFTKIFRGISLGTTPRDPLGKSVVMMAIRRLKDIRRKKRRQARLAELQFPGGGWGEMAAVSAYLSISKNSGKENKPLHPFPLA